MDIHPDDISKNVDAFLPPGTFHDLIAESSLGATKSVIFGRDDPIVIALSGSWIHAYILTIPIIFCAA